MLSSTTITQKVCLLRACCHVTVYLGIRYSLSVEHGVFRGVTSSKFGFPTQYDETGWTTNITNRYILVRSVLDRGAKTTATVSVLYCFHLIYNSMEDLF
jgi:hypothetical protein